MKRIDLPFYPIFICEICGHQFHDFESAKKCEGIPVQKPNLKIGDRVKYEGEEYTVCELHYSHPGEFVPSTGFKYIDTHTLYLSIRQYHFLTEKGLEKRAWRPGDAGYSEIQITYDDLIKGLQINMSGH